MAQAAEPDPEQEIGKGKAGPGRGNKTGDDVTRFMERGNNADYQASRIARDRPDIHERMKQGEFKSVRTGNSCIF